MDINKINEIIDSYSALRENFEIQKSFLELKSAYSDFIIEQPIIEIDEKTTEIITDQNAVNRIFSNLINIS